MNDTPNTDPRGDANRPEDVVTDATWTEPGPVAGAAGDPLADGATEDLGAGEAPDDLGAGAFDAPTTDAPTIDDPVGDDPVGDDPVGDGGPSGDATADATPGAEEHDAKPKKAYLGRPELAPLYAMAGLADLAAAAVRDIANEQIAAYRGRRSKTGDVAGDDAQGSEAADAQFNDFLTKAQQRTQEIFDQAVAQYEQLADRGRVAVGEAIENAKHQQKSRTPEDVVGMKPEDVSAAAQKAADKIAAAVQTAADRVSRAADESAAKTADSDATPDPTVTDPTVTDPTGPATTGPVTGTDPSVDTEDKPNSPQV